MTRGYIAIVQNNSVESAAFIRSSAYLEYYGKKIIEAFMKNSLDVFMCEIGKAEDFDLGWIRSQDSYNTKPDYNLAEYGYIYNREKETLTVYSFGTKLFVVNHSNAEKWLFVAENESALADKLSYNEDKLKFVYDNRSIFRELRKASLEDIKRMLSMHRTYTVLSRDHILDHTSGPNDMVYIWNILFGDDQNRHSMDIFARRDSYTKQWKCYIQLPWIRAELIPGTFSSESRLVKELIAYVKTNRDYLVRAIEVMKHYASWIAESKDVKSIEEELHAMWVKENWATFFGAFDQAAIIRQIAEGRARKERKERMNAAFCLKGYSRMNALNDKSACAITNCINSLEKGIGDEPSETALDALRDIQTCATKEVSNAIELALEIMTM